LKKAAVAGYIGCVVLAVSLHVDHTQGDRK